MRECAGRRRVVRRPGSGGDWRWGRRVSSRRRTDVTLRHDASAAAATVARNALRTAPSAAAAPHRAARPASARNLPQPVRWQPCWSTAFPSTHLIKPSRISYPRSITHITDTYLWNSHSIYPFKSIIEYILDHKSCGSNGVNKFLLGTLLVRLRCGVENGRKDVSLRAPCLNALSNIEKVLSEGRAFNWKASLAWSSIHAQIYTAFRLFRQIIFPHFLPTSIRDKPWIFQTRRTIFSSQNGICMMGERMLVYTVLLHVHYDYE